MDDLEVRALKRTLEEMRINRLVPLIEALVTRWERGEIPSRVMRPSDLHPLGFTEEQIRQKISHTAGYRRLFGGLAYLPQDFKEAFRNEPDAESLAECVALERRVRQALFQLRNQGRLETASHHGELYWSSSDKGQHPARDSTAGMPDATGLVRAPNNPREYLPASKIISEHTKVVGSLKKLHKILRENPAIRRWQPTRQRLMVHDGDFRQYIRERGGKPLADVTADEMSDELERRKPKKRRPSR